MKTREQIIENMCYTYRHDFGLDRTENDSFITSGMTDIERRWLRATMSQIFDKDIAPYMEFKKDTE